METYRFPVSPAQGRLLVLERMNPGTAQYNMPAGFVLRGPFDIAAFSRALEALVARHEALRTVFRVEPSGSPVQVVSARGHAAMVVETGVPVDEVRDRMLAEAARPFDLATGPLVRCAVFEVDDGSHRLLLTVHHLVCDGWSLEIMLREVSAAYAAETGEGPPYEPVELPIQYPDYAGWQSDRLAGGDYEKSIDHWSGQLEGAPDPTALPTDFARPPHLSAAGANERLTLPAVTRLAALARGCGATVYMVLFAAFASFMGRLCGQDDIIIGMPVSGRDRPELQDMVGMLTNTLAVRVDLTGDPSFRTLVERVRARLLDDLPHQDAPFEAVVDAVATAREPGHDPLVQVMIDYVGDSELTLDLAGVEARPVEVPLNVAKFDLLLYVERWGDDLIARFNYRTDILSAATVARWARNLETLLDGLLADPDTPAAAVELLPADERGALLAATDRRAQAASPVRLVPELIADQAARTPSATALVCGEVRLTYRQLLARADAVAARLRAHGVGPDVPVGLLLPRSADMAVAALAVLRAGGAYVPLDPAHPRARLAYMVADSRTLLVLATTATAPLVADLDTRVHLIGDQFDLELTGSQAEAVVSAPMPENLAYVLYTSGSTGTPKGVAVSHRALLNLAVAVRPTFPVEARDRVLQYVSFGFDVAVSDLFFTWVAGAELHIAAEDERLGEPLLDRLRDSAISYVFLPPSAAMSVPAPGDTLPHLRTLAVGGEACPSALVERWAAPDRRVVDAYGPSEATVYATTAALEAGAPVVIGRPVPGVRVHVLDRRLRLVPVGVTGEIYLAGASLARGYAGQPGMTAERFVADPYGPPGARMYRTGDLGRHDADGVLAYLGRVDTQVKVRGFRVELGEIENTLASHPGVAQAAAKVHGEATADRRLVAYVVAAAGEEPTDSSLRAHLAASLPSYMVPEVLVRLEALPVNRSGKVRRSELPVPPSVRPALAQSYVAPGSETERRVSDIWARALDLDSVGAHDNFFDLGGNSVRLLSVETTLREDHPDITLADLFRYPTVSALAAHLDGLTDSTTAEDGRQRGNTRRERLAFTRRNRAPKGPTL